MSPTPSSPSGPASNGDACSNTPKKQIDIDTAHEQRLSIALENSRSGIWDWDLGEDFVYRSPTFERFLGFAPGSIRSDYTSWLSLIHPEDRARVTETINRFLDMGAKGDFEVQYRLRSGRGSWRWIMDRGRVTQWRNDVPVRFIGTHTDVTYRQAMEDTLRMREAQLRAFVEKSPSPIGISDRHGAFVMVNRPFAKTFGLEPVDLLGKTAADFMPDAISALEQAHDRKVLETMQPSSFEFDLETEAGRIFHIVHKFVIASDDTEHHGIGSVHTDVTAFRQNEQQLIESQTRFQDYTELAADWYWETDAQMRFTNLSPTFAKHTGADINAVLGRTSTDIAQDRVSDPAKWAEHYENILARRDFRDFDCEILDRNGERIILKISGKPVFAPGHTFLGYRGTGRNVTQETTIARQIAYDATHDPLTNLFDRRQFEKLINEFLGDKRLARTKNVLCFLDLDRFKIVNDVAGHATGDQVLREIAQILLEQSRETDILARIGGDEFGLLLKDCQVSDALTICEKIINATRDFEFTDKGRQYKIGISIGAVNAVPGKDECADLLSLADNACYSAKLNGRNRVEIHEEDGAEAFRLRQESRQIFDLPSALENDRFVLFAHPIVPLARSGKDTGFFEVLTRMKTVDGGLLAPDTFIHAAERHGIAADIDRWVIRNSLKTLAESHTPLINRSNPALSINLSGQSLNDVDFYDYVSDQLNHFRIAGSLICFEITETAAIDNLSDAASLMQRLRKLGCRFALDDFGTGLSSFGYLKELDVDYLKIDGKFIRGIHENVNRAVVLAVQELAHTLYMKTVAEYVEDESTADFLRSSGIDYAQGYAWGEPEPLVDVLNVPSLATSDSPDRVKLVHSRD